MSTALVTGAAGFIGSHLTEALIEQGYEVRALDNLSTGNRRNLCAVEDHRSFTFIQGNICDKELINKCLEDVDYVFHQAAVASVQRSYDNPSKVSDVNCTGTSVLIEAAIEQEVETVVVASSAAVYGSNEELPKHEEMSVDPESPYALSKHYTEQAALQLGAANNINTIGLRYFNVYGPRQDPAGEYAAVIPKFTDLMLDGERPVIFGDGEQSRDFVYVYDVVKANMAAAESGCSGEVVNIANGNQITINKLVDSINSILGTTIQPKYQDPRPGDIRHSVADVSNARAKIGYEPTVEFREGLEQTINSFNRPEQG